MSQQTVTASASPVGEVPVGLVDPLARRPFLRKPARATLLLAVILTTQLMVILDGTVVNVALPYIQNSLHFSATNLSWVISGYTLAFGGLLMFGARCGDLLGRRRTFLAGIAVFTLGSLAGGIATTDWLLLVSRAVQGVGGAFAAPATLALLTSLFPEGKERIRAIGLFTAVSVGGGAIGLVAGGVLINLASWRWCFFVNVPVGLVVFITARFVLPETPTTTGRFDVLGALTSTFGVGGLVLGFIEAASDGWGSAISTGSFIAGVALLALFIRTEQRAEQPILPLRIMTDRTRNTANASRSLVFAAGYGIFFFMTQYLQDVRHYSALKTGFAFLPIPLSVFLVSQLTTRVLLQRFNPKLLMLVGLAFTTAAFVAASGLGEGSGYPRVVSSLILMGIGNGISFVTLTGAALQGVQPQDAGAASGVVNVTQQIGPALGVAIMVTAFGAATKHVTAAGPALFTHGVDRVFMLSTVFVVSAFVMVALGIPRRQGSPAPVVSTVIE